MKKIALLSAMALISVGCEGVRLGGVLGPLSVTEKTDNRDKDNEQDRRLNDLERRLKLVENIVEAQQNLLDLHGVYFSDLQAADNMIQNAISSIIERLDDLEILVDDNMDSVQSQLDAINVQIASLEVAAEYSITELIDPCGDGPGFDEVILKLGDGSYIAYFQQGNNRHLSVLPAGNYQTTDQQKCNFSISASGNISWQ